ncbi:hypothetical protein [Marinibactrum halimedae]|uniref:Uncharacterized protein n=1 Tax=Marinibactrum halimedae TaxID=1444977 RepID=A0AA37WNN4_9GAMM|nr:hypothetical protein [Marinibactrum halimedae]MCD9458905.1 hypothetical protein [Marinibactrum halimedae]GLS27753.1 hypothetical protein GCM10007877_34720 [Marinibactrum halimedae]
MSNIKERIAEFIVRSIDKSVVLSIQDRIYSGYKLAYEETAKLFKHREPSRPRAQQRHYLIDEALGAPMKGVQTDFIYTKPKGEQYVVLSVGDISISHCELHDKDLPRPAKYREMLAQMNKDFDPPIDDMLSPSPLRSDNGRTLHIVMLVIHSEQDQDLSIPKEVIVAVPHINWKDFHLKIPIVELLQMYTDMPAEEVSEPDNAWPDFRKEVIEAEQDSAEEDSAQDD